MYFYGGVERVDIDKIVLPELVFDVGNMNGIFFGFESGVLNNVNDMLNQLRGLFSWCTATKKRKAQQEKIWLKIFQKISV